MLYPNVARIAIFFIVCILILPCGRVSGTGKPGARAAGLAFAAVALQGKESLFQNQAGLAGESYFSILLNHDSRFLLKEYSTISLGAIVPVRAGVFGAGITQFGTGIYREQSLGLTFSRKFGNHVCAGMQFSRISVRVPEREHPDPSYTTDAGIQMRISGSVTGGIHFSGPFHQRRDQVGYTVSGSRVFRTGVVWQVSEQLLWCFDTEKQGRYLPVVRSGLEFQASQALALRAGVAGAPFQPAGGAGFHFGNYGFDMAFSYHPVLGFSPSASICIAL